ncbi:MAG: DivIVA domain-containing protein [Lachnospiraceae bacterium]|nr:DivIVA domain-containing protein [Lachnospiraceae bacterium]
MLSPLDLQSKKVVTKKRKYEKAEMDEYLELVFENYKALFNENQELQKKIKTLSDGIQYYRSIESTMQKALVLAEKTSKETKDAAVLKAEAIEKEANSKASKIISEAEQEYEKVKDKCLYLMQQFNQYKLQLKQVATAQLELITSDSFDVNSPELESLQYASHSLPPVAEEDMDMKINTDMENDTVASVSVETENNVHDVSEELVFENDVVTGEVENLDKTMVLPDIKKERGKKNEIIDDEETASILTADTIDLRDSIEKVKEEEENNIQKPVNAEPKEVKDATVIEPVNATPSEPLDIELKEVKTQETEVLEPVSEKSKDAPTLDSLLQSMNMSSKKKKKKGQEEDPFEFLGSVDDF